MSCYKCASKFRLFNKEIGCNNCGYSFCSKCCDKKAIVPKKDMRNLLVCYDCYDNLKNGTKSQNKQNRDLSPPENFKKLVEKNTQKQMHEVDEELNKRLNKLIETKKNVDNKTTVLTQEEIETRLNKLMGKDLNHQKNNLPTRSVINNADDLIKQVKNEAEIDKKVHDHNQVELEKLEERLKKLTNTNGSLADMDVSPHDLPNNDSSLEKFLRDVESKLVFEKKADIDEDETVEKVCCICDNDAWAKCTDCDDDFYCQKCFKQGHKTFGMTNHRKIELH